MYAVLRLNSLTLCSTFREALSAATLFNFSHPDHSARIFKFGRDKQLWDVFPDDDVTTYRRKLEAMEGKGRYENLVPY
jgi:hypothetical protein